MLAGLNIGIFGSLILAVRNTGEAHYCLINCEFSLTNKPVATTTTTWNLLLFYHSGCGFFTGAARGRLLYRQTAMELWRSVEIALLYYSYFHHCHGTVAPEIKGKWNIGFYRPFGKSLRKQPLPVPTTTVLIIQSTHLLRFRYTWPTTTRTTTHNHSNPLIWLRMYEGCSKSRRTRTFGISYFLLINITCKLHTIQKFMLILQSWYLISWNRSFLAWSPRFRHIMSQK